MPIVTVEKARSRLGLAATADHRDAEIADLIAAAEGHVEDLSGHYLERRQVTVPAAIVGDQVDVFPWPIVSIDGFDYRDGNGTAAEANVEGFRILDASRPWRIKVGEGSWPADYAESGEVTVTAGYASLDDVPPKLVHAVLLLVAQWFEDPTGERPISPQVKALCYGFRNVG